MEFNSFLHGCLIEFLFPFGMSELGWNLMQIIEVSKMKMGKGFGTVNVSCLDDQAASDLLPKLVLAEALSLLPTIDL